MKTLSIVNQKGGIGKSTTALAICSGLSLKGFKTLFIDLDSQGNSSLNMRADQTKYNALGVLQRPETIKGEIQRTEQGDILASCPGLASLDMQLTETGKEYRLKESLSHVAKDYDYAIIDTPPHLGTAVINALTASTAVLIPTLPTIYSIQGISQLSQTIATVRKYCNPSLQVIGVLLTQYTPRSTANRDMAAAIADMAGQMGTTVFKTYIRRCQALQEAQIKRVSIYSYAPKSNAAKDYNSLIEELSERGL